MTFAEILRKLRIARAWSQKDLAEATGFTQASISRWESGASSPTFKDVQKLCEALGVKCTEFDGCEFGEDEKKRQPGRPLKPPDKKREP